MIQRFIKKSFFAIFFIQITPANGIPINFISNYLFNRVPSAFSERSVSQVRLLKPFQKPSQARRANRFLERNYEAF